MRLKIQNLSPDWQPPTLADKVLNWVKEKQTATGSAIRAEFIKRRGNYAMPVKNALNSLVTAKRLTVDKKENYSVSTE